MRKLHINSKITVKESTSFTNYLTEIADIEMFSPEEEFTCAERAFNGDEKAAEELIKKNLRFVVSVAKQYSNSATHIEDLVNEGNIGLIFAVRKFDPSKGFKFITFAVWWIRKIITEYLSSNAKLVRLPSNKISSLMKLNRQIDVLEQNLQRTADISEIIEACVTEDVDSDEIRNLDRINNTTFDSFDREIGNNADSGTCTVGENITGDYVPTDDAMIQEGIRYDISRYMACLKNKAKRVITAFYGLDGNAPMSLAEIGHELGVTREMARQIKVKSLIKLKEVMKDSAVRN